MKKIFLLVFIVAFASVAFADLNSMTQAANKGGAEDQYALGMAYLNGDYDMPDLKKAMEWFEKAARQNHPDAMVELGTLIFFGDAEAGIKANKIEACKWLYTTTADGGDYLCAQLSQDEKTKAKAESDALKKTLK